MDRIVRRSAQMWAEVLARFADSGLSALQFCEQEGINIKSFARWRTRLTGPAESAPAKRASPVPKAKPGFIDLGTMPASARMELRLDLGGGVLLHVVRG